MVNLDPAFVIDYLHGLASARDRFSRAGANAGSMHLCAPAVAELRRSAEFRSPAYRRRIDELVDSLDWLDLDTPSCEWAARIASDLASRGERLPGTDLFVAAIALRHGHGVLTRNPEYSRVPGLRLESY